MKARRTWIVVADGARARIALNRGPGSGVVPAMPYEFAAPHAPTRAFVSDRPGYHSERGTAGHRFEPKHDRHHFEKQVFARDLAEVIDDAAADRRFDRLVLVAPPAALGRLRAALTARARRYIVAEVRKDLTHLPLRLLPRYLEPCLAA